ncbi:MAG TPA: hypothetical protein VKB31_04220 [Trueperaceae bacterium]|nr:hypothetical protein [Trueperaceae bacterium]
MVPIGRNAARVRERSDPTTAVGTSDDRAASEGTAPNRWMGECGCLIGPFTCRQVAERFVSGMVEFGQYECVCQQVVVHSGSYYVRTTRVAEARVLGA